MAATAHGPVHSGQTGTGGVATGAGGGPAHTDPAPFLRPERTPSPPRRGPGLRRRLLSAGLRKPGGRIPGLAPFRRALGPPLDGPGPLQRVPRERRRSRHSIRVALPRLPDPGPERRRPLRPAHPGTYGRRPDSLRQDELVSWNQRIPRGHRPLPHGGARVPAGGPVGRPDQVDRQPGRRRLQGVSRAHHLLCALPRPQVRCHQPGGLLRPLWSALRRPAHPEGHRRPGAPRLRPARTCGPQGGDPLGTCQELDPGGVRLRFEIGGDTVRSLRRPAGHPV